MERFEMPFHIFKVPNRLIKKLPCFLCAEPAYKEIAIFFTRNVEHRASQESPKKAQKPLQSLQKSLPEAITTIKFDDHDFY